MPELHVVAAGSLLEFQIEKIGIPVGRVSTMYMYPLTFTEFLTAGHNDDYLSVIAGIFRENNNLVPFYIKYLKPDSTVHLLKKLKSYWLIEVTGKVDVNGTIVEDGVYKINFKKFDRSSKKSEYIGDKRVFENFAENSQEELISIFDDLVKNME
jgi:hypothetical protein